MTQMEQNPFTISGAPPPMTGASMGPSMQGGGGYPVPAFGGSEQYPMKSGFQGGPQYQSAPAMPQMQSMGGPGPMGDQQSQWLPGVARPQMTQVSNPPVVSHNIQYGPSYSMAYSKRSTADKTAVKYTGFLPLEGVYEEDTCRIG